MRPDSRIVEECVEEVPAGEVGGLGRDRQSLRLEILGWEKKKITPEYFKYKIRLETT